MGTSATVLFTGIGKPVLLWVHPDGYPEGIVPYIRKAWKRLNKVSGIYTAPRVDMCPDYLALDFYHQLAKHWEQCPGSSKYYAGVGIIQGDDLKQLLSQATCQYNYTVDLSQKIISWGDGHQKRKVKLE